jgi:hypothetical protein
MLLTDLHAHVLEACFNGLNQHIAPLVRRPDHLGVAPVEHMLVALGDLDLMF